jgi:hypothetical protein
LGLDFDKTSAHAGLGAMIQRANYPLKNSPLGPPVKEDKEVLPLLYAQHLERGFAVRQYLEVFVRWGPFGGYGYSRQLGHNGLGRSVYLKANGSEVRAGSTGTGAHAAVLLYRSVSRCYQAVLRAEMAGCAEPRFRASRVEGDKSVSREDEVRQTLS